MADEKTPGISAVNLMESGYCAQIAAVTRSPALKLNRSGVERYTVGPGNCRDGHRVFVRIAHDQCHAREIEVEGADMFDADPDDQWFMHNVVSAAEVHRALRGSPDLDAYRNADVRTFGKAMAYVPGWESLGYVWRFKKKSHWYRRVGGDDHRFTAILNISAHQDLRELADLI